MEQNVGKTDRAARLIAATFFIVIAAMYSWWWLIASVIILLTALTGKCGLYRLIKIKTKKTK